jgi:hypothetical protein
VGIQTGTAIRDNGEEFQEVTGTAISSTKRGLDIFAYSGMAVPLWDYVALVEASTTDTWTFREGGSGGTIVSVVVITYTDSSKGTIANVERTS